MPLKYEQYADDDPVAQSGHEDHDTEYSGYGNCGGKIRFFVNQKELYGDQYKRRQDDPWFADIFFMIFKEFCKE